MKSMRELIQIRENFRNRWTLFAYWGMRVLVGVAALGFAWERDWASVFATLLIAALMFVPPLLKEYYKVYLPFALEFGIVAFIFLTLFLGWIEQFYDRIPLWDAFLHFQSGLLLGATGYVLVYILNEQHTRKLSLSPGFVTFFATTFSITVGVLWEIFEFVADTISTTTYWQGNDLGDTMYDLIANAVGTLIVGIVGYIWMRHRQRLPFPPRLLRIFSARVKSAILKDHSQDA